ncbi:Dam family site-specific DNA-(adenine-N6)-methyltransferase [Flavobacteriaceae bacterium]|nr:Dam family site-specific DNA-(adenine-N6)-methyltransferase [Flavobacteriaceae bacterium]
MKPFSSASKPLLRWVGGKTWSLPLLSKLASKIVFKNYFEPFFGGGAFYFSFNQKEKSYLSDINKELIITYNTIKNEPKRIIDELKNFQNTKDFYYELRDKIFENEIMIASRFIYLNKTSFNGIYRVNMQGKYNVPYGNRNLNHKEVSQHISIISDKIQNSEFSCEDFEWTIEKINKDDLVYLDPPYTVTHNENGFIKYNEKLFSKEDQIRLASYIDKIKSKGAYYILSNANHSFIRELFEKNDFLYELERKSSIGAKVPSRGIYSEILITNIKI